MKATEKILALKAIDSSNYESIDLDRLVIYAVAKLAEMNLELSLENIIVATFKLFPSKFSILGYPEFPDATRVEKCLWRCKGPKRGWIGGKTPHGYTITETGNQIANQAANHLLNPIAQAHKLLSQTRRRESIIAEVKSSQAYQKFIEGNQDKISEAEFCYVLQGTLDSLKETLRNNFESLKIIAEELQRADVSKFIKFLEKKFSKYLN